MSHQQNVGFDNRSMHRLVSFNKFSSLDVKYCHSVRYQTCLPLALIHQPQQNKKRRDYLFIFIIKKKKIPTSTAKYVYTELNYFQLCNENRQAVETVTGLKIYKRLTYATRALNISYEGKVSPTNLLTIFVC